MRNAAVIIILLSFAASFYFYSQLPGHIATHWNAKGEADAYMPKEAGVLVVPFTMTFLVLVLLAIPKIDPLKANIKKFEKHYDYFVLFSALFFLYVHFLVIIWNIGTRFSIVQMLLPGIGLLLFYLGVLMEKAKRNWFVGIRTPWTLSNDKVWEETHKVSSKLFKLSGFLVFASVAFPQYASLAIFFPLVFAALFSFIYSYHAYEKKHKKKR
jgi:uncharacterized membrane protein